MIKLSYDTIRYDSSQWDKLNVVTLLLW